MVPRLVLTPAGEGMKGAIAKAQEIAGESLIILFRSSLKMQQIPRLIVKPQPKRYGKTLEVRSIFSSQGIGTGGTITGVSEVLKARKPSLKVYAVEPEGSPVLSGGSSGPHKIQGIGAGFIPEIFNTKSYDAVIKVNEEQACQRPDHLLPKKEFSLVFPAVPLCMLLCSCQISRKMLTKLS